jgi:RNA polymerase sigma-70 factor (ECF subfamily)
MRVEGGCRVPERTGDDERFAFLYNANRAAVVAYCRRRVPGEVVDDVIAEVFLTAWRRIDQVPSGSELPWLYGVARYVVANHQRSSIRRSRLAARVLSHGSQAARDMSVTDAECDRSVLDALAALSPSDQELLRLRAWEELNSAEIGLVLGIAVSAVDMRLSRARRRFERALRAAGFVPLGAAARLAEEGSS